jgi:hypothetical protein
MSATALTVLRYLVPPGALILLLSWLLLPSRLQVSRSVETTATSTRGSFKGQEVVYLQTAAFGEVRVPCSEAVPLCGPGKPPPQVRFRVWLQDPGFLYSQWVVAAEYEGKAIVTPESQAPAYRLAKVMWAIGTLVAMAVAFVLWRFGPFKEPSSREA